MHWRERSCVLLGRDPPSDGLWGTEKTERIEGSRKGRGNCPTRERRDPLESRESGGAQDAREGRKDDGRSADGDDWGTSGGVGSGGEGVRRSGHGGPNERMGQQGKGAMGQG